MDTRRTCVILTLRLSKWNDIETSHPRFDFRTLGLFNKLPTLSKPGLNTGFEDDVDNLPAKYVPEAVRVYIPTILIHKLRVSSRYAGKER